MKTSRWFKLMAFMVVVLLIGVQAGCRKSPDAPDSNPIKPMEDLIIAPNFEWNTTQEVTFTVVALDNQDKPLKNVRFNIYTAHPDSGGVELFSGATNAAGLMEVPYKIPAYLKEVTVTNTYVGLVPEKVASVSQGQVTVTFGGKPPKMLKETSAPFGEQGITAYLKYLGTFSNVGTPNYLEPENYPVTNELLDDINASLPEQQPVPVYHPEYLANTAESNLPLVEDCDVWVSFIHEGAGWRNVLGFFTFPTNDPPQTASEIDMITIVFPNLSYVGSGGGLYSGNKVYMGQFPAGISIGWVIFANGWNGSVTNGNYLIYSVPDLNPEANPNLRKHTVLLKDPARYEILFAFEDIRRDQSSCDQDFNDGILMVQANPIDGINTDNMPNVSYTQPDEDGDGIPDVFDDYPTNPDLAFNNYYPSETGYSSLAFEDLWPGKGDYDFNDLVLSYRTNQVTNANNEVVYLESLFIPEAMGAQLHNGFGFQLPILPSAVDNVTGLDLQEGYITLSSNNTEAAQTNAVIIIFDDGYNILPYPGTGTGVNTDGGAPYVTPDTLNVTVTFKDPIPFYTLGSPLYNPFLIVNQTRGKEVHLSDMPPTDLADPTYFGTVNDDSKPAEGRYYKTVNNLPWAFDIVQQFDYVYEYIEVNTAYLKFNPWAESSGASYDDWFQDKSGYRVASKIYIH